MIRSDHDINAYLAELDRARHDDEGGTDWLKGIRAEASDQFGERFRVSLLDATYETLRVGSARIHHAGKSSESAAAVPQRPGHSAARPRMWYVGRTGTR